MEGIKKSRFSVAREHAREYGVSIYFEDTFQTRDQVTGNNWCDHSQKQNQNTHSDNQVIPLLCRCRLGSVEGELTLCRLI